MKFYENKHSHRYNNILKMVCPHKSWQITYLGKFVHSEEVKTSDMDFSNGDMIWKIMKGMIYKYIWTNCFLAIVVLGSIV